MAAALAFDRAEFVYDPYPMGLVAPLFDEATYDELVSAFPPPELFQYKPSLGHKYSLSSVNNPGQFHAWLRAHPVWDRFHDEVRGGALTSRLISSLVEHRIDLGLSDDRGVGRAQHARYFFGRLRRGHITTAEFLRHVSNRPRPACLNARMEFSMMSAAGGHIRPHTDAPQKLITLVVSMTAPGEWDPAWGGGTNMDRAKDRTASFNLLNRYMDFDDVEPVRTYEFRPNQCVVFVKTFNSLHSVPPMTGPESALRRTVTINIEHAGTV